MTCPCDDCAPIHIAQAEWDRQFAEINAVMQPHPVPPLWTVPAVLFALAFMVMFSLFYVVMP